MENQDYFYADDGCVHWIYRNSDAFSGEQFVELLISKELLDEAIDANSDENGNYSDAEDVWNYLEGNCPQFLYDKGESGFDDIKDMYLHAQKVLCTEDTLDWLISYLK